VNSKYLYFSIFFNLFLNKKIYLYKFSKNIYNLNYALKYDIAGSFNNELQLVQKA